VPAGSEAVVIPSGVQATVRENGDEVVALRLSVTRIVGVATCGVVGVPVIRPVEAASERPAGSVPLDTAHVNGLVPPATAICDV
jgi:hypothetical protein